MGCPICAVISLGSASPRCSLQPTRGWLIPQEGRALAETSSLPSSVDDFAPAWPCSRRGLPGHLHYGKCRWSLTPPFHHHYPSVPRETPPPIGEGWGIAVCFCGPFPAGLRLSAASPPRVLSGAVLYGVRTFLDPINAGPRPPNQPELIA
jgi:hypothetical protein